MGLYNDLQEESFDDLVFGGRLAGGGLALLFQPLLKEEERPLPRIISSFLHGWISHCSILKWRNTKGQIQCSGPGT